MTLPPEEFDGPHKMRREEIAGARRLDRICFGGAPNDEPEEELTEAQLNDPRWGTTFVTTHEGRPVSQISIFHNRIRLYNGFIRLGSIGGVCTHPDYRGLGLAGTLLDHCTRQLRQEGASLMLISGGRGLYTRVGCVPTGQYTGFTIRSKQFHPPLPDLGTRPATKSDALLFGQLYQAEPVHFVRRLEKFTRSLDRRSGYTHAEQWIVRRREQDVAYVLMGIPWEHMGNPDRRVRVVTEYAGSRTALANALSIILYRWKLDELQWDVPWQDIEVIQLLQELGLEGKAVPLEGHTMRIINFPGLMRDLSPYIQSRLEAPLLRGLRFDQSGPLLGPDPGDCFTISRGKDRLELDGAAMTSLVMGDPLTPRERRMHSPGALADVVSALFPLPSFLPGLNYQ